jgi:phosphatidylglycerophosphatase A
MTLAQRASMEFCTLVLPGRIPFMPGTWGSLTAVLLAPWLFLPLPLWGRILALLLLFALGGLAATVVERRLGIEDPGRVIIDEVLGQWLVFLPFAALGFWELAIGLALFRLFDIAKPPPIRSSERWLPEGFGVMLDDVLAGLYAMAALWLARLFVL